MQSLKDISKQTGLAVSFLRKCKDYLHTTLQSYETRGNKNALLYDDTGVVIFERIRQLKAEGLSLPSIKSAIETDFPNIEVQDRQLQRSEEHQDIKYYVTKLLDTEERLNRDVREKESEIRDWIQKYESLAGAIKMLPGGSPEEVQKEMNRMQDEITVMKREHQEQQENIRQEQREQQEQIKRQHQSKQERIGELIQALKQTEGRFFQGKKRKNLLNQLKNLTLEEK